MITAQLKEVEKVTAQAKQLSLGVGGITEETDPTVPDWAKQPTKPTYTADEVGALPKDTKIPSKPEDIGAQPANTKIPSTAAEVGAIPVPSTATVGQTIKVSAIDATGKPTAWEAVDFPEGGGGDEWRLIKRITLEENITRIPNFSVDDDGNAFDLKAIRVTSPNIASSVYVSNDMHGRVWIGNRDYTENRNDTVFKGNSYIEISMTQNPSNYPFWGQIEYMSDVWCVKTSNGTSGYRTNRLELAKRNTIQSVGLGVNNGNNFRYAAGVVIEFWGVDA